MLSLLVVKSLKISIYDDNKPKKFLEQVSHGLTVVDELGTSFSYERDNPKVKRNFTLCHELGHFILKHNGNYFAESIDNQENLLEREANIFSAVVLMPDIILLSKIYYSCETFHQVQNSLEVSKRALFFRLLEFLREYYLDKDSEIKQAVDIYILKEITLLFIVYFIILKKKLLRSSTNFNLLLLIRLSRE